MKAQKFIAGALSLVIVGGAVLVGPLSAFAQTDKEKARQKDKNNTRNLGIGLGAGAVYEALKGKKTNAVILGAGAAYSAKKSEDARKAQSKAKANRERRSEVGRSYRYKNGRKVGYYRMVNGKKSRIPFPCRQKCGQRKSPAKAGDFFVTGYTLSATKSFALVSVP